jgi:hypothetical protein
MKADDSSSRCRRKLIIPLPGVDDSWIIPPKSTDRSLKIPLSGVEKILFILGPGEYKLLTIPGDGHSAKNSAIHHKKISSRNQTKLCDFFISK